MFNRSIQFIALFSARCNVHVSFVVVICFAFFILEALLYTRVSPALSFAGWIILIVTCSFFIICRMYFVF